MQGTKGMVAGGAVYAVWVAFAVSFMLYMLFNAPLLLTFIYILDPKLILIVRFSPVMNEVNDRIVGRIV